jgi:CO/xanthine dehydrogenase Mo-binding subunit
MAGVAASAAKSVYHATEARLRDLPTRLEDVLA